MSVGTGWIRGDEMQVTISNEIYVQDPAPELVRWARENLVIPNPEYRGNPVPLLCGWKCSGTSLRDRETDP